MALETVQDYIGDARTVLQDLVQPFRYDDSSLTTALNVGMYSVRRDRPDLFLYTEVVPQFVSTDQDVTVPMEEQFRLALLFHMCAHALLRDQEDIQDAKAASFAATAGAILTGRVAAAPSPGGRGD